IDRRHDHRRGVTHSRSPPAQGGDRMGSSPDVVAAVRPSPRPWFRVSMRAGEGPLGFHGGQGQGAASGTAFLPSRRRYSASPKRLLTRLSRASRAASASGPSAVRISLVPRLAASIMMLMMLLPLASRLSLRKRISELKVEARVTNLLAARACSPSLLITWISRLG